MLSEPSGASTLPPQNPRTWPPELVMASFPARTKRSPQLSSGPYFILIGHSSRLALSRLVLSGQLRSGSNL